MTKYKNGDKFHATLELLDAEDGDEFHLIVKDLNCNVYCSEHELDQAFNPVAIRARLEASLKDHKLQAQLIGEQLEFLDAK